MDDKTPGIMETLTANKKVKVGVLFFILALILGFSAVYTETKSYSEKGYLNSDQTVRINRPRLNAQGKLLLYNISQHSKNPVEVSILNQKKEVITSTTLRSGENKTVNLIANAEFFRKEGDTGRISYIYHLYYPFQPYRLFSIPALFLTFFGIVLVYKGFDEYMNTLKKVRKSSKSRDKRKQQDINFMGIYEEKEEK